MVVVVKIASESTVRGGEKWMAAAVVEMVMLETVLGTRVVMVRALMVIVGGDSKANDGIRKNRIVVAVMMVLVLVIVCREMMEAGGGGSSNDDGTTDWD